MTDLAADYEKLADRAAAKMAKLPSGRGRHGKALPSQRGLVG